MVSVLESFLKDQIAAGFKGQLTRGYIRRVPATTMDSAGDAVAGTATTYTFEGIRDTFTARFRATAGIPETDVRVLILLGSVVPPTTPLKDDEVFFYAPWNKWYQLRNILEIDPAGASATCQAYEIPDPT